MGRELLTDELVADAKRVACSWCFKHGLSEAVQEEVESDALYALLCLADEFNPSFGVPFKTFVLQRLRFRIVDEFRRRIGRRIPCGSGDVSRPILCDALPDVAEDDDGFGDVEVRDLIDRTDVSAKKRKVLHLLYAEFSLREAGEQVGVHESRVSQMRQEMRPLFEGVAA